MKQSNQKLKCYLVYRYLMENSDENHCLSQRDIVDYLENDMGVKAERRSIYKDIEDINQLERSYAEQCQEYLDSGGNYTAQQWAAYESRITACSLIASDSVVEIDSLYFTSTTTMETSWWRLKELESNVYLRIITGQVSVDFFDKFVQEWENLGGTTISKEVEETINRDK